MARTWKMPGIRDLLTGLLTEDIQLQPRLSQDVQMVALAADASELLHGPEVLRVYGRTNALNGVDWRTIEIKPPPDSPIVFEHIRNTSQESGLGGVGVEFHVDNALVPPMPDISFARFLAGIRGTDLSLANRSTIRTGDYDTDIAGLFLSQANQWNSRHEGPIWVFPGQSMTFQTSAVATSFSVEFMYREIPQA